MKKWVIVHTIAYSALIVSLIVITALYDYSLSQNQKLIYLLTRKADAYNASLNVSEKVSEMYDACVAKSETYDFKVAYEDLKDIINRREAVITEINSLQSNE